MLNTVKSNFSFTEINKKNLPAIYSTVFRCVLVVLLFFWLYCITTAMLACENIRFSSLFAPGDVSRGGTSATQRQKFHTDDAN